MSNPWVVFVVTFGLIAVSAFFVAVEFALLAARRHRLEEAAERSTPGARCTSQHKGAVGPASRLATRDHGLHVRVGRDDQTSCALLAYAGNPGVGRTAVGRRCLQGSCSRWRS